MTAALLKDEPHLEKQWTGDNPLNRIGLPHEFKGAAVFLASNASTFCTGSDIRVDGGHTAW
jgi:NAD(P)-dependent dehydrogenase (short-subunit alcohol dehydrogenase family)